MFNVEFNSILFHCFNIEDLIWGHVFWYVVYKLLPTLTHAWYIAISFSSKLMKITQKILCVVHGGLLGEPAS